MCAPAQDSGEPSSPDWFAVRQRSVRFDRRDVARFAGELRRSVAGGREFGVRVASDAAVRQANRRFLGKDCATDVLSFPSGEELYLGDILISASQARRQARALGHPVEQELKVLLLHGGLHLLGYDHERDNGAMRRVEQRWRRLLGLPSRTGILACPKQARKPALLKP